MNNNAILLYDYYVGVIFYHMYFLKLKTSNDIILNEIKLSCWVHLYVQREPLLLCT